VTEKSAPAMTVVVLLTALSAGTASASVELADEATVIVPCTFIRSSSENVAVASAINCGCEQVTVPGPSWPMVIPAHDAPVPAVKP